MYVGFKVLVLPLQQSITMSIAVPTKAEDPISLKAKAVTDISMRGPIHKLCMY